MNIQIKEMILVEIKKNSIYTNKGDDYQIMNLEEVYYTDYPSEPIGGTNPYYKCSACGASDPHINGKLENHFSGCEWVKKKNAKLKKSIDSI